jgi:tripartite-type tricarboxylate transporter receptor subunit TctC
MIHSLLNRRQLLNAGAATVLSSAGLHAMAAEGAWPAKIVRMVVAFPAGGPTDIAARITAQKLGDRLGTSIMVDNRPGASGSIGTASFIKSPADGNTLSMFGMPALLAPLLYNNGAYDVEKDFACVSTVYDLPMAVIVNPAALPGAESLAGLIAQAKAAKVPLNYTSSGAGSFGHLAMEQLKDLGGFDMQHVPYRGSAPAVTDLLGGQLGIMFADVVAALPHIRSGKLRAIAVSSPRGKALLPGVRTIAEQGFPGFDFDSWGGLIAPVGTPAAVVGRINRELKDILANDKDLQDKLLQAGAIAGYQSAETMRKRLLADRKRWTQVAKDKNISAT